jgi:hypothetical protein
MLSFFEKFDNPALEPLLKGLRQNVASADLPFVSVMKGVSVFGSIAIGPLMVALFGVFIWVGLWIMRQKVDCGRAIAAMLMASSIASIIILPCYLLGFNVILLLGLGCLLWIPYVIFYHRLHGAAIQRSAWVSFGAHLLFGLILGCCGFACMVAALGGIKAFFSLIGA